jgi:thiol-disulfide isomerase/thioredoxin
MASLLGQPVVLNFWGTWCPPCVKEMPELDQFQRQWATGGHRAGGRVVGLAVDNPTAVREFLARRPVSYTIGLAGFEGTELSRQLGNTQGSLPFTALFNRRGDVVQRKLGAVDLAELQVWTRESLAVRRAKPELTAFFLQSAAWRLERPLKSVKSGSRRFSADWLDE